VGVSVSPPWDLEPITSNLPAGLHCSEPVFSPPAAPSTTKRSSLELLTRPLVFSQSSLLDVADFIKAASGRRIPLDRALLEDLHRHRLLIPLIRCRRDDPRPSDVIALPQYVYEPHRYFLDPVIAIPAVQGRLTDPASERFRLWERHRPGDVEPLDLDGTSRFQLFYSPYQVLALHHLSRVIAHSVRVFRNPRRGNAERLNPEFLMTPGAVDAMASWRSLAILLHAIDSRYRPVLTRAAYSFEDWRRYASEFDAKNVLTWLGADQDDLRKAARVLRSGGSHLDVTGDFFELIRRARPDKWESLEGDALLSIDFRIAAELLDMFADDLEGKTLALDPLPKDRSSRPSVRDQRLLQRPGSLDGVLTRLNLSPYPSLVIAVEGETEERIIPKVFGLLGFNLDPSWIQIECFGGVEKDLMLLTRYVSRPLLGEDFGEFAELDRPFTRFLILVDAESRKRRRYITYRDREKQRALLFKAILEDVDPRFHSDLRRPEAHLITIRTWNKYPFEFAHFTPSELADGLIKMASAAPPQGRDWLRTAVADERRLHRPQNGKSADIEQVWNRWSPSCGFSKTAFADVMWPVLEANIADALAGRRRPPPVLRNVRLALQLASMTHRMNMGLRSGRRRRKRMSQSASKT